MSIPDYQTIMLPLVRLCEHDTVAFRDAIEMISEQFNLSEEEKDRMIPSGRQSIMRNRVSWAITYLVKAGILERPQPACVCLTKRGREVLNSNPSQINNTFLMQYEEFRRFRQRTPNQEEQNSQETEDTQTPDEQIQSAHEQITNTLKSELLSRLQEQSPTFFEKLVIDLLSKMRYGTGEHLGKTADGGLDGVIKQDYLGLENVFIQAKRYAEDNKVTEPQVREFAGTLSERGVRKGVYLTTSSFTNTAKQYVESNREKRIVLIDGEQLTELMIEHGVGVRETHKILLKKVDEDYFSD